MQNKKGKITAMFLSSVLACTAMVSAITGTQVNGAYTKSTEWETQSVVTTASGKEIRTTTLHADTSIETSQGSSAPTIGDELVLKAHIDTGDRDAGVKTVTWYVNGEEKQTSSINMSESAEATYHITYDKPATVNCVFGGTKDTGSDADSREVGYFTASTPVLTVGSDEEKPVAGSKWSFSECTGLPADFASKVHGDYTLTAYASDGKSASMVLELLMDKTYTVKSDGSGNILFGDKVLYTDFEVDSVILTLDKTYVSITKDTANASVKDGDTVTLSVEASAGGDRLSYSWFQKGPNAEIWTAVPGANKSSLELTGAITLAQMQYYCRARNDNGVEKSTPATLSVLGYPKAQPTVTAYYKGAEIQSDDWMLGVDRIHIESSGAVYGTGSEGLKYSLDNGKTWTNVEGNSADIVPPQTGSKVSIMVCAYNTYAKDLQYTVTKEWKLDNVGPEFTVSGNPTAPTKKFVTLKITGLDAGSGLTNSKPYSFDGGKTWTGSDSMMFETNQNVVIAVRDALGNTTIQAVNITYIDQTPPTAKITGNPTDWQAEAATLTVDATDNMELANEPFSWDNGKTWTKALSKQVTENGTYSVLVRDAAGNETTVTAEVNRVDTTAPEIKLVGIPENWTNQETVVSIDAKDTESGLAKLAFSWDGGSTWADDNTFVLKENGALNVAVRDTAGNIAHETVVVSKFDMTEPTDFTITGVPKEWTSEKATLSVLNVKDSGSGLDDEAYNWNNEGWTKNSTYEVKTNGVINLKVRDKAGNIREKDTEISKLDNEAPVITGITGIPTQWQKQPVDITVTATDSGSGLDEMAYSFDDGETWQASATKTFDEAQAVGLKVRDKAGNETYHPFMVQNVDAKAPTLNVSYLTATSDMTSIIVGLYGVDAVTPSDKLEYCFDYNMQYPEFSIWTTANQSEVKVGKTVTVACRDEMGNVSTERITPNLYDLAHSSEYPLIQTSTCPVAGYTFGAISGDGKGVYLDTAGVKHEYQSYGSGRKTVSGLMVEIEGQPLNGGYLAGKATLNGATFPIYWGEYGKDESTQTRATGRFVIDPSTFRSSFKNASLKITLTEYEDAALTVVKNTDVMSAGVIIDTAPPVVNMDFDSVNFTLELNARDAISGIEAIRYQITDKNGTSDWYDYTGKIALTTSSKVKVMAVDKVENVSVTDSRDMAVATSITESANTRDSYYYRTNLFDHYLYGSGKTSLAKAPK